MSNVPERTALVLGGGGLKGFAHIGVLRALEERGIRPSLIAGTSIGALIGAAYAGGMSVSEMTARAVSLRRRDLFRINHVGMLFERMRCPSLYLEEPLRDLCAATSPAGIRPFSSAWDIAERISRSRGGSTASGWSVRSSTTTPRRPARARLTRSAGNGRNIVRLRTPTAS